MARSRKNLIELLVCACIALDLAQTIVADFRCREDQFICGNETCIPGNWRCDGEVDCGDSSDEKNCPVRHCNLNTHFKCKTGDRCIPKRWVCDFADDCGDNSDEPANCAERTCSPHEYACGNGHCIPMRWLCDHDKDCEDGSDEQQCGNKTCDGNQFTCGNSKCISRSWVCDLDNDCTDFSDEKNCPNKTCKPTEFTCNNGMCVKASYKCDGDNDCQDGSDELGCPTTGPTCKHAEFQCKSHQCVHKSWKCDGENDCNDGSDEKGCNVTSCGSSEFTCTNGRCIPIHSWCDGSSDCLDNSDEQDCVPVKPKPCKKDEFQCGNTDQCIPYSKVCDGNPDCKNGLHDEPLSCSINECKDRNGHCQQICNDTKTSFFCSCHAGFKVDKDDSRGCRDVDECEIPGSCSQACYNQKGSFKCICRRGYVMEPDRRSCKAIGEPGFLIFANRQDIRHLSFDSSDYREIVPKQRGAIALDYDFESGYIFWTDVIDENIRRTKMHDSSQVEDLVKIKLNTPDGIAVDWINKKLYWTDTGVDMIEVSDFDGKNRLQLVTTNLEEPRAIVVHPFLGFMFWTDWGEKAKIEKCGMNGDLETRQEIVNTNIMWPNALAIDYTVDKIWFADAKLHTVESSDLDGRNRRVVLSENINHPFALTIFQSYIYWTDWHLNAIHKANKFSGGERSIVMESLFSPMDIHVYHRQRQPTGMNPCSVVAEAEGCSHICLLAPKNNKYPDGFSCHCPPGVNLLYDQRTCNTPDAFNCTNKTCHNGGTCVIHKDGVLPSCTCTHEFTGKDCSIRRSLPPNPTLDTSGHEMSGHEMSGHERIGINVGQLQDIQNEDVGVTAGISVAVIIVLLALGGLIGWLVYRRIRRNNLRSMSFDNPVYKKTTESNGSLDRISIRFGHSHGKKCQSLLSSFRNEVEIHSC